MLILDTDLLSLVQRESGDAHAVLEARLQTAAVAGEVIGVTIISFEEQMRGWLSYVAAAKSKERRIEAYSRLHMFQRDYSTRRIVDFDAAAADRLEQLLRAKVRIPTMDLRIAAIALANNAKLLSRNLSDFRKVPGLQVEDWTKP